MQPENAAHYLSQKPFGFFGISAIRTPEDLDEFVDSHKSLSASLAFLPMKEIPENVIDSVSWSQKPFGFFGISADNQTAHRRP